MSQTHIICLLSVDNSIHLSGGWVNGAIELINEETTKQVDAVLKKKESYASQLIENDEMYYTAEGRQIKSDTVWTVDRIMGQVYGSCVVDERFIDLNKYKGDLPIDATSSTRKRYSQYKQQKLSQYWFQSGPKFDLPLKLFEEQTSSFLIFFSNAAILYQGNEYIIPKMKGRLPFQFKLPPNLPPSYEGKHVKMEYKLIVQVRVSTSNATKILTNELNLTLKNPSAGLTPIPTSVSTPHQFQWHCTPFKAKQETMPFQQVSVFDTIRQRLLKQPASHFDIQLGESKPQCRCSLESLKYRAGDVISGYIRLFEPLFKITVSLRRIEHLLSSKEMTTQTYQPSTIDCQHISEGVPFIQPIPREAAAQFDTELISLRYHLCFLFYRQKDHPVAWECPLELFDGEELAHPSDMATPLSSAVFSS
mmetsp:Transcript_2896/g.4172  ORF Transcript_2896/g.4172 Transcript_2896/m.4172 type:complete len:420 (+) Transcript_2896:120-1379(+)